MKIKYLLFSYIIFNISCKHQKKFTNTVFESLSSSQTHIKFQNKLEKKPLFNILYYLYYYNGGGVALGDINNDGLPDIYFTANSKGNNKLYLNKGNFEFEDITDNAGVNGNADWCTGATMADVNGDGLMDIYVSTVSGKYGLKGENELYINNGNNTFTNKAKEYGLNTSCYSTQTVFFDYDHDGDLDCFILNQSHRPNENIVDTSHRKNYDPSAGDKLYRNDLNTNGKFTDVSKEAGIFQSSLGYGLGISVADFNNDGWEDMYIGNDFHENDYYYINQKNGKFLEQSSNHFNHYSRFSMGNDAADFNNDGQMDIATVDMLPPDEKTVKTYGSEEHADIYDFKISRNGFQTQLSRNCLQKNNGNGVSFSDIALQAGMPATDWSWCPLFADFNNDGKKDLLITSGIVKRPVDLDYIMYASGLKNIGMDKTDKYDDEAIQAMPDGASHPFLFQGNGIDKFDDVSLAWGTGNMKGYFNGAAYADLNNDGKLDLVINCLNAPAVILKNVAPAKNYLTISLKGNNLNTSGLGAKVYLFSQNGIQFQQLMLTRGFQSSSEEKLHFGLDSLKTIDSILVVWPNNKFELVKQVSTNKSLTFFQKNANDNFEKMNYFNPPKTAFINITDKVKCNWQHIENNFNDFNYQYLIPHKESTRGPKIAVADVNKDGLDDFYVCGAKGQPGALMIQQKDGTFKNSDTTLFKKYAICEDVDALFFDANGDGFPDLWVVGGGNEMPQTEIANADRLFVNDGKGNFKEQPIPQIFDTKSCITVADIDHDGDLDVFIGHLCDQTKFGLPVSSYLYINDGKGKFTIAPHEQMNILNLGMVTAAQFADINHDGWADLIVTGEWMGVKIYINNQGKFVANEILNSTGLWQSLYVTDVNHDGLPDILAGNWGQNSKLWYGKNGPLKLYVKDFDFNGTIDQVMCYTIDGKEYTFLGKDELEKALPVLKKAYLKYSDVAGKDVQYMFYDLFKDYSELKAETLASTCFVNQGNGNFKQIILPNELQLAPLFGFTTIDSIQQKFIGVGNFYGVIPFEGRYDAQYPSIFSYQNNKNTFLYNSLLPDINGEFRDVKWLKTVNNNKILLIAKNNGPLVFLAPNH